MKNARDTALAIGLLLAATLFALYFAVGSNEPTVEERLESIRCEQWGGRFDDPCGR